MTHVWVAVYEEVGIVGVIRRRARVREDAVAAQAINADELVLQTDVEPHQRTHYITGINLTPTLTDRPAATATIDTLAVTADGSDTATISGLTDATDNVFVVGPNGRTALTPSGGTVALQFDTPGTYFATVFAFPKRRVTFAVVAS